MRKRTRNSFSYGSMWMSDAPLFSESISSTLTSSTTGAASEDLVRGVQVDLVLLGADLLDVGLFISDRIDVDLREAANGRHVVEGEGRLRHHVLELRRLAETATATAATARLGELE